MPASNDHVLGKKDVKITNNPRRKIHPNFLPKKYSSDIRDNNNELIAVYYSRTAIANKDINVT